MTSPNTSRQQQPVDYKGEPLDAERGPGLGCFWFQMILLVASIIFTPLTVNLGWPLWITMVSFVVTILLLLLTGQTMIFLLRIVAASRTDGRRRPLASTTPTVGELEDEAPADEGEMAPGESPQVVAATASPEGETAAAPQDAGAGVRQYPPTDHTTEAS